MIRIRGKKKTNLSFQLISVSNKQQIMSALFTNLLILKDRLVLAKLLKLLLPILFLFSSTLATSQAIYYGNKLKSSIDLVVGGDFGFRIIETNSSNQEDLEQFFNRESLEKQKLNYRFGFNYYHGLNSRLMVKTGLRFANPGFSTSAIEAIDIHQDINTVKKTSMLGGVEYHYNYQFVEVPLAVKYVFTGSVCEPYFEAGIATNFYRKTIVEERPYEENYKTNELIESVQKVNYFGTLAIGGDFFISQKLSGFTQLVARYQLNDLRNGPLTERMISLGFETGIRIHLR